jgi:choline kinase
MKLIILAAGDSFELNGFNKLLLKNPLTRETILDQYIRFFEPTSIKIVLGYKAIDIMNEFPNFDYIINENWQTTGSAYSLYLALNKEPCYVISSDLFFSKSLNKKVLNKFDNHICTVKSESKRLTSLNAKVSNNIVSEVYRGKSKNDDFELVNFFKITNPAILNSWKKNCKNNPEAYVGELLPYFEHEISNISVDKSDLYEINTNLDFINYLNKY